MLQYDVQGRKRETFSGKCGELVVHHGFKDGESCKKMTLEEKVDHEMGSEKRGQRHE